jgi:hypothetical protein
MPVIMPWPLVPRNALGGVVDILSSDQSGGVALLGGEGVGKSTLAAQAAERLGLGEPVWVIGTLAKSAVPFGAFGPLLPDIPDAGKPAAMLSAAAESILAQANSAPIIVDNARLLDPLSASLVYRLAKEEKARPAGSPVIVTVRSVLRVPQVVSALWEDGLLERVDLPPMDATEIAALVAAAGGTDPDDLYKRTGGNPLHLRMLLSIGLTEESLPGAIDKYLNELTPQVRTALEYLCVFEPLSRDDLAALAGEEPVAQGIESGALEQYAGQVYAGHALYLERLAAMLQKPDVQRLRSAIAAQLSGTPSRTPADRLSRTVLAVQGDAAIDADAVVAAAEEALRLGDHGLAERLARGALDRGEHFHARLALSTALGWQGRGREAESVLAGLDIGQMSEEQLMAWALPRAANQFWMLSEPERAAIFLHNIRARMSAASSRSTLDGLSATFAMNAANIHRALEVAGEVLAQSDAPDMAVAWAASATALCSARSGDFAAVSPAVERVLGSEYPGLLRFTVGLAEITTLLFEGKIDEAHETARKFTDFAESVQPGRAIGDVLMAQVLLARGETSAAVELLKPAATILARTGYSWGPLALMYLTTAQGYLGEVAESGKTLARAMSIHGTKSAMFGPELGVARAWRLATIGDRHAAITAARDAARTAKRTGQLAVAVWAWHEAARLGDRRAADALAPIAEQVPCVYSDLALAHARAVAAGDPAGLREAAQKLNAAGFLGAAADATRQADEAADQAAHA